MLTVSKIPTLGESMSTQRKQRRSRIRRTAAFATGVITALAIAAPIAGANAATPPHAAAAVAVAPTLRGDVFNGALTIVTSPSSATGNVVSSP